MPSNVIGHCWLLSTRDYVVFLFNAANHCCYCHPQQCSHQMWPASISSSHNNFSSQFLITTVLTPPCQAFVMQEDAKIFGIVSVSKQLCAPLSVHEDISWGCFVEPAEVSLSDTIHILRLQIIHSTYYWLSNQLIKKNTSAKKRNGIPRLKYLKKFLNSLQYYWHWKFFFVNLHLNWLFSIVFCNCGVFDSTKNIMASFHQTSLSLYYHSNAVGSLRSLITATKSYFLDFL